jgi:hypothetical protein
MRKIVRGDHARCNTNTVIVDANTPAKKEIHVRGPGGAYGFADRQRPAQDRGIHYHDG